MAFIYLLTGFLKTYYSRYIMYNPYNPEADTSLTIKLFKNFLLTQRISKGSVRSYLSDVRHFLNWLEKFLGKNHVTVAVTLLNLVNQKLLETFCDQELANNTPVKTLNRRFSSLRKFGQFLETQGYPNNFDTLRTISPSQPFPENEHHLKEFRVFLWQKGSSKVTIKNYLNDTKQFLLWKSKLV